jgi:hypothetical protein
MGVCHLPISPKKNIAIEDLLDWAYRREKVHLARDPALMGLMHRWSLGGGRDSTDGVGEVMVSTSMNLGFEAPADAYAVAAMVSEVVGDSAAYGLVLHHAKTGGRPDWVPHPVVTVEKGVPLIGRDARNRRIVVGYAVSFHGDVPEILDEKRGKYDAWWNALDAVRKALRESSDSLKTYAVTEAMPPQKPWLSADAYWWV